jgi:hypothetical protein
VSDATIAQREIESLLAGHTDRHDERVILRILGQVDAAELDATVRGLDLRRLVGSVDDRRVGPKNRTALLELLAGERLVDLGVEARAALTRALQRGRTDARDERAIVAIFRGTRGEDLTTLKERIDGAPDHRDLHQLVYRDVDTAAHREELLAHIAAEGRARPVAGTKLLSDIDDTVYANWKDERFPKKTIYPGVRALYRALSGGEVVFLTARPGDRPGVVERKSVRSMLDKGFDRVVMLAGSLGKLHSNAAIAAKKIENYDQFRPLYPEHRFVFFGDSGQGDAEVAEHIVANPPPHGARAFIHDVVAVGETERARMADAGVGVFDSYVEAARACVDAALLGSAQLAEIARACREDLEAIVFDDDDKRRLRFGELDRALVGLEL